MKRAVATVLCVLLCFLQMASGIHAEDAGEWVTFLLLCNEGMRNDGGDVGNTLMVMSVNAELGIIKQVAFLWNTFVKADGYEMPQLLSQAFRVNGPEEAVKVFNRNFNQNIESYLSINFLNLSSLIDEYGGITLDITRAERNALNGMVASKKRTLENILANQGLGTALFDSLFEEYYLLEHGPDTQLSGIQAVGYGWLQYDTVANCCTRAATVIAQLFFQVRAYVDERVVFYTDARAMPEELDGKRPINADHMTEEDERYVTQLLAPIFEQSYNNLTDEQIVSITRAILKTAYAAYEQEEDVFDMIQFQIMPLENGQLPVELGGVNGIVVDYEQNALALNQFLYHVDGSAMVIDENAQILPAK